MTQRLYETLTGLDGQSVSLQSLTLLEATSSLSTLVSSSEPTVSQSSLSFDDDDDVFQCGRCKKQFTSLAVFMHHKREECSNGSSHCRGHDNKSVMELSNPFMTSATSSGHSSSEGYDDVTNQVLTSSINVPNGEISSSPTFINAIGSSPVLHLAPSMVLSEDTLSFIPVDQHGALSHLVAGHNSSQVLSVSESDLNTIMNSGERYHLSSIEQISNPISSHGIILTASLISASGKDSNIQIISSIPSQHEILTSHNDCQSSSTNASEMKHMPVSVSVPNGSIPVTVPAGIVQLQVSHNLNTEEQVCMEVQDQNESMLEEHENLLEEHECILGGGSNLLEEHEDIHQVSVLERTHFENNRSRKNHQSRGNGDILSKQQQQGAADAKRKCEYCGKQFKKLFNLHQHIRSHTGEKPFHCLVCGRGFTQKSNVKKHMQTHKVWPKIKSTLPKEHISVKFKNEATTEDADGEQAESIEYVVNNVYVCQYCEANFENYHKLKTHLSHAHKKEKLFKCIHKDCLATFLEVEGLIAHMKTHEAELEYQCQNCPKKFKTLFDLGAHQYSHRLYPNKVSTSAPKQFRCTKCNSKYASAEALNHHLLTSSHNYPCSQCRLVFVCERYLRRHLRIHGTVEPFKCDLCGKMFKTENYLKSHLVIHSDNKPYRCETCGAVFNRRDKLTRHKLMHETRKKYKCPFKNTGCSREFYRKDKLKDHMLSHSRKVYLCTKCGKTFSWPTRLRHHQAANHPEMLANTTCFACNKIFKTKHHLKIHVCKGPDVEGTENLLKQTRKNGSRKKFKNLKLDEHEHYIAQEVEEMVLYGDCDIMEDEGSSNEGKEGDAMLSGLAHHEHDADYSDTGMLSRYSESDEHDPDVDPDGGVNSDGVLSSMEINFETNVDAPMDPLMAGD